MNCSGSGPLGTGSARITVQCLKDVLPLGLGFMLVIDFALIGLFSPALFRAGWSTFSCRVVHISARIIIIELCFEYCEAPICGGSQCDTMPLTWRLEPPVRSS